MVDRTYPYEGWVLMPSFRPAKLTFTHGYGSGSYAEGGKWYVHAAIHALRSDAITDGHNLLNLQQARLDKQLAVMKKRRAELVKAET